MFHEDNGFREMFIYGSVAMLAALALPAKKAHAAEIFLCGDGRMLELTHANRAGANRADACVTSWFIERQKAISSKDGRTPAAGAAVSHEVAYQIQTSAIEPLINAVELPEGPRAVTQPARREKIAADRSRARREPTRKVASAGRAPKGMRHMGDGIFAE